MAGFRTSGVVRCLLVGFERTSASAPALSQQPGAWPHLLERCDMANGTCSRCEGTTNVVARGLCSRCYANESRHGRLDRWPKLQRKRRSTVTCSIEGCDNPLRSRGWCATHWDRWRVHGDPRAHIPIRTKGRSESERFWCKVDVGHPAGCWEWAAGTNRHGYGIFDGTQEKLAHRWAYAHLMGSIPDGLTLDHLCRNPPCVNPDHLEPVTQAENTRRGFGVARRAGERTHCPQGHPYSGSNLYITPSTGARICRACSSSRTKIA